MARGYLNRPDLTAERFIPNPFSAEPDARLYKTGDLARYLPDGTIEFLGCLDHQVKLRGFRIELGEIEAVLGQNPAVREVVVVARDDTSDDKRLVAYVVLQHRATVPELRRFLQKQLPAYMVPAAFVPLDALPLTANGKVDRRALPAPDAVRPEQEEIFVAPRTATEEVLASIWTEVLGFERLGIHDNFFDLGGHSLAATRIVSRVREAFQVELPLRWFFDAPSIAELARVLEENDHAKLDQQFFPLQPIPRDGYLPLSFAQKRVWFIQQLIPMNIAYIAPTALRMTGVLDVAVLEQCINELVWRHEVLRTTFPSVDGQPVQLIHAPRPMNLPLIDLRMLPEIERTREAQRLIEEEIRKPFDITQLPLIRWTLVRLDAQEHMLVLVEHHLVHDGWSTNLLLGELFELYKAFSTGKPSPLPHLPIQFADFAYWQHRWMQGEMAQQQLAYWKEKLAGSPPLLELPTDRLRPPIPSFRGAKPRVQLLPSQCKALRTLCRQEGVTQFMALLAIFLTLLHRYSKREDICVGSGIANRRWRETESMLGMIINTVVLRTDLSGNPTFRELLKRVREVTLEASAHQDLPFEEVVRYPRAKATGLVAVLHLNSVHQRACTASASRYATSPCKHKV